MTDLKSISQWLIQESSPLNSFYVIYGSVADNTTFVEPVQGVVVTEQYVDGSSEFYVDYGINTFKKGDKGLIISDFDTDNNDNINDYGNVKELIDWVYEQNIKRNLPTGIDGWQVLQVKPTNALPRYAGTDEAGLSKYMAFLRVFYTGVV